MPTQLIHLLKRTLTAAGLCLVAAVLSLIMLTTATTPTFASTGITPPSKTTDPSSDGTTISSRVTVTGSSNGEDATPITSSDATWTAARCWYEPYFTPDEFEAYIQAKYDEAGQSGAGTLYDYYHQVMEQMNAIHYHKGDDGKWWMLVMNDHMPEGSLATCPAQVGWQWVDPQNPAPVGNYITPEMLSQVAYGATKLPSRKVKLSPSAANQVVNLATYAKFADPINRVWVTAQLANAGIAATVVAVPDSLRIDAGTDNADPHSCTYGFSKSGNTYQVDTSKADCNITYRKSTSGGSYTLTSRITWKVTWTATATPNGATAGTLPDGYSDSDQNIQVKEIQTVNR